MTTLYHNTDLKRSNLIMKEYTRPELEITEFELEDVIAVDVSYGGTTPNASGKGGWY